MLYISDKGKDGKPHLTMFPQDNGFAVFVYWFLEKDFPSFDSDEECSAIKKLLEEHNENPLSTFNEDPLKTNKKKGGVR